MHGYPHRVRAPRELHPLPPPLSEVFPKKRDCVEDISTECQAAGITKGRGILAERGHHKHAIRALCYYPEVFPRN